MTEATETEDDEILAEIRREARTNGAWVAYRACVRICEDPKSPAQSVSSASRTLFQIAGLLEPDETTSDKELAEMNGDELRARQRTLQRQADAAIKKMSALNRDDDKGEFGAFG